MALRRTHAHEPMNGSASTGAIAIGISVTRGVVIMPVLSVGAGGRYA
jgi:hypothetical protein